MKQKYTITVAGMDINIITEQSPETVEYIVGTIDRRIREMNLRSPRCSRTESALLCAMDYCADKLALSERVKELEKELSEKETATDDGEAFGVLNAQLERLAGENGALKAELEVLRSIKTELDEVLSEKERLEGELAAAKTETVCEPDEATKRAELERIAELEELLASAKERCARAEERCETAEAQIVQLDSEILSQQERITLLETSACDFADDVKAKQEKIEALYAENLALKEKLERCAAAETVTVEEKTAPVEEKTASVEEKPRVRRFSEQKTVSADQISIDGGEIPEAAETPVKRRERRVGNGAFDLLNTDDV